MSTTDAANIRGNKDDDGGDLDTRANAWLLTVFVLIDVLSGATLMVSAHHLFMMIFHLENTDVTPHTKFKLMIVFVLDFLTSILILIGLTILLDQLLNVC